MRSSGKGEWCVLRFRVLDASASASVVFESFAFDVYGLLRTHACTVCGLR